MVVVVDVVYSDTKLIIIGKFFKAMSYELMYRTNGMKKKRHRSPPRFCKIIHKKLLMMKQAGSLSIPVS